MYTKGKTTYAEAYRYLRAKGLNMVALQTQGSADDFTEEEMARPLEVTAEGKTVRIGRYFMIEVRSLDYAAVKTAIIKTRYSNDDQMAIILNRFDSEEDSLLYERMQEWREFAAEVARGATVNA